MKPLPLIIALAASPAYAEPNDLIPDSGFIIGYTHHAGGSGGNWDEGLSLRGVGLTWETTYGGLSVSGYKNSLIDGGAGYSLTYSTPAILAAAFGTGVVSAHGVAQINWYPDEPTEQLEEMNGVFRSFGVSMRYTHEDGAGLFMTVYPSFGYDKSFEYLYIFGAFIHL